MNENNRLGLGDTPVTVVTKMSDGHPGAAVVVMRLLKEVENGVLDVYHLDDMGLYGLAIWVAYKDCCHEDLGKLSEVVRNRDLETLAPALAYR